MNNYLNPYVVLESVGWMLATGFGLAAYTRGYAYSTPTRSEEVHGLRGRTRTSKDGERG